MQWLYALILEAVNYMATGLLDVFSMDLEYFESTVPATNDILNVITALGWALLLGNLVFQAAKSMLGGIGFESDDPKELFARSFVFSFLLLASRQICEIGLGISSKTIRMLGLPAGTDSVFAALPEENAFSVGASWLIAIVVGVVLIWQIVKLFFEIGERYVIVGFLTIAAPLAFAMGGSASTGEIFKGWARMYASMCLMMVLNVVFLKMLMSAMIVAPSGAAIFPWMIFVVAIARVARKIDGIIARIGLNPAITGDGLGRSLPGALSYIVLRSAVSTVSRSAVSSSRGSSRGSGSAGSGGRGKPPPGKPPSGHGAAKQSGFGQKPRGNDSVPPGSTPPPQSSDPPHGAKSTDFYSSGTNTDSAQTKQSSQYAAQEAKRKNSASRHTEQDKAMHTKSAAATGVSGAQSESSRPSRSSGAAESAFTGGQPAGTPTPKANARAGVRDDTGTRQASPISPENGKAPGDPVPRPQSRRTSVPQGATGMQSIPIPRSAEEKTKPHPPGDRPVNTPADVSSGIDANGTFKSRKDRNQDTYAEKTAHTESRQNSASRRVQSSARTQESAERSVHSARESSSVLTGRESAAKAAPVGRTRESGADSPSTSFQRTGAPGTRRETGVPKAQESSSKTRPGNGRGSSADRTARSPAGKPANPAPDAHNPAETGRAATNQRTVRANGSMNRAEGSKSNRGTANRADGSNPNREITTGRRRKDGEKDG
jgi:hypothetical protein